MVNSNGPMVHHCAQRALPFFWNPADELWPVDPSAPLGGVWLESKVEEPPVVEPGGSVYAPTTLGVSTGNPSLEQAETKSIHVSSL
jgi:hypothetical protein